jgi:AraC-like DNA-binding protein
MDPYLPAVHALELAQVLTRWDVSPSDLFAGLGVSEATLSDPAARLPTTTFERLVERARKLSSEPGLGYLLGLQMRISIHGMLGMAAMTASTVREALAVAVRFAPTRTNALRLRLQEEGTTAAVGIDVVAPLGSAEDVVLLALIVGIWQIGNAVSGRALSGDAELTLPEPSYHQRFRGFAPGEVRFSQPANRIVFDRAILDLPLVMADPSAQKVALKQCEQALDALGQEGQFVSRVRSLLRNPGAEGADGSTFRTLDEVAPLMSVSERTLKRRLAAFGTSYSELVDDERRDQAMLLIAAKDVSVDEIALRLGYSDAANFTRAFRRWTGKSPRAHRRGGDRT